MKRKEIYLKGVASNDPMIRFIPVRANLDNFGTHRKLLFLILKYRLNDTFLIFPKFLIFKNSVEGFWKMSSFSENDRIYEFF